MADAIPPINIPQKLAIYPPAEQQGIPVPLDEWHRIMNRIERCTKPTNRLEAFAWAAFGAALSFFAVAITLPFGVEWVKIDSKGSEHVNVAPCLIEIMASFSTLLFAICGGLALYWAWKKQELQSEIATTLIDDMKELEKRHRPIASTV